MDERDKPCRSLFRKVQKRHDFFEAVGTETETADFIKINRVISTVRVIVEIVR